MYVETSYPRLNKEKARLVSPDLAKSYSCLDFYYHMYGDHVNRLNVFVRTKSNDVLIWTVSKNQGDTWKRAQVPLVSSARSFQVCWVGMMVCLLRLLCLQIFVLYTSTVYALCCLLQYL